MAFHLLPDPRPGVMYQAERSNFSKGGGAVTPTAKRAGQRGKRIEDVVAYAVSHKLRVQILLVLQDGVYSTVEIAEILGEPLNKVSNHMRELLDAGSIEIADSRRRRNTIQHFYRAVEIPLYSKEETIALTPEERQLISGLIIQSFLAEVMAGLWAGKMNNDPDICLAWKSITLDDQGRREVAAEQEASLNRIEEIHADSHNRIAESAEETIPYVISIFGFERALKPPRPRQSADGE